MAEYRYLLGDILDNTEIYAELPFTSATYSHVLNSPGAFQGSMSLNQSDALSTILGESLIMGRSTILVERDGVLVWGGICWTDETNFQDSTYTVNAEGWHSYFRRRTLTETKTYALVEQVDIAADLINWAQAQSGGDIGVGTTGVTPTGRVRDRTYLDYERKNIGEALEQLAAVIDGFDFRYETARSGDVININFLTSYPATGRETDLVFELGVQLDSASATTDATNLVTHVDAIGAILDPAEDPGAPEEGDTETVEVEQAPLIASVSDITRFTTMPRLDDVISETDIITIPTLEAKALLRLARGSDPVVMPSVGVDPAQEPRIGSYREGDLVTIRAVAGFRRLDGRFRITEYSVTVDGNGGESAALVFGSGEVFEES